MAKTFYCTCGFATLEFYSFTDHILFHHKGDPNHKRLCDPLGRPITGKEDVDGKACVLQMPQSSG